jgi:hypothetical protein
MIYIISSFLIISTFLNLFLFFQYKKKPKKAQSIELQEFLADLMGGVGIVAVSRIDPGNILLRSPRQK